MARNEPDDGNMSLLRGGHEKFRVDRVSRRAQVIDGR